MSEPAPAPSAGGFPFGVFFQRAFRGDLDPVRVLPDEHAAIEVERVHGDSEPMRKMLLWRRAALFIAFALNVPPTVVELVDALSSVGGAGKGSEHAGIELMLAFANVALVIAVWLSFRNWSRWSSSRKSLYWTWFGSFAVFFLMALIPKTGAVVVLSLLARVLALVPGLLRSAVVTKIMFPSTPAPGLAMSIGAPFYLLLLYVVLLMPYHVAGGGLMAPAIVLLMAAPVFIWRAGKALSRPRSTDDVVAIIKAMKTTTLITNTLGALFLIMALFDLLEQAHLSAIDVIQTLLHIIASIFTLSIIGVDLMVTSLMRQHVAAQDDAHKAELATYAREMSAFVVAAELAGVSAEPVIPRDPLPPEPVASKPKAVVPLKPPPPRAAVPAADDPLGETQPGGPPPPK